MLVLYDVTDRASFEELKVRVMIVREHHPASHCVLVGTKCDGLREVSSEEVWCFAQQWNMSYVETSAKTGDVSQKRVILIIV